MTAVAPAILARNLSFSYPSYDGATVSQTVLQHLDLQVEAGTALTVAGSSGSGKSTLCHVLAGLAPRHTDGQLQGLLHLAGHDILATAPSPRLVGLLFQDAAVQLFNTTAEDEVAWGLEALGVPSEAIGAQVMLALRRFGLLDLRHRAPWQLSGGQQKRLALAALWAMRPQVLLLDEPLQGLDPVGQAEVLGALELLRQEGSTLLFTTPDFGGVARSHNVALLEGGLLAAPASAADLAAHSERLEAAGIICPTEAWNELRDTRSVLASAPALEARNLRFRYPNGPAVLHGINLTIPRGEYVALIGTNGAGKTTLARHFNGLLRPTMGTIQVMGQDTALRSTGQLAREVGFLFQRPEQQLFAATVREELTYGLRRLRLPDADARVESALMLFGLHDVAASPPAILGYGRQRAVTLATLAALAPSILILDEPTAGLDGRGRRQLLAWLSERRAAGTTLVCITHEMALARLADRVIVLHEGRITADGAPSEILPHLPWEVAA
ncbi:MAG: ATP-binding cassette domain-containing protein [Anaerolineae bacterium]|nr:ATP-binding cassette domain-containing protein [Anaerolineae bacterium]